jgi:hypothetical protein|tara:strand:+ start:583 stop:1038 length:456 start_codon:yes stop_codon:yes gene_type:complete
MSNQNNNQVEDLKIDNTEDTFQDEMENQNREIMSNKNEKRYVLTIYQVGDTRFSAGDRERQVCPRRFYQVCSTSEIPEVLKYMEQSFWQHPDLLEDSSNSDEISFEEKKWGRYRDVIIEPFTEELEKSYLDASKKNFFKMQRDVFARGEVS